MTDSKDEKTVEVGELHGFLRDAFEEGWYCGADGTQGLEEGWQLSDTAPAGL